MDVSAYINSPIHPSFARMVVVIVESNNKITVKRLFLSNALTIHNDASEFITCGLVGVANSCLLRLAWVTNALASLYIVRALDTKNLLKVILLFFVTDYNYHPTKTRSLNWTIDV